MLGGLSAWGAPHSHYFYAEDGALLEELFIVMAQARYQPTRMRKFAERQLMMWLVA